jgi:hypothetical protein
MTTRKQWLDIAARCEAASGQDSNINGAIGVAVGNHHHRSYTASIDAITSLIGEKLPNKRWLVREDEELGGLANIITAGVKYVQESDTCHAFAATPALALCAAFCRAMADREEAQNSA